LNQEYAMRAQPFLTPSTFLIALFGAGCGGDLGDVSLVEHAPQRVAEFSGDIFPGPCSIEWDFGLDGVIDYRKTYVYDQGGTLLFEEWDRHADGVIDSRRSYSYDAQGEIVSAHWDRDANGTVDTVADVDSEKMRTPIDEDELAAGTRTYAFDADGNIRLEEYDPEHDGVVNARAIYSYDQMGNLQTKEWDDQADGSVEWRGLYIYDCWRRIED